MIVEYHSDNIPPNGTYTDDIRHNFRKDIFGIDPMSSAIFALSG